MAIYARTAVLDTALQVLTTNVTTLHLCSSLPASYTDVTSDTLANATITVGAAQDLAGGGREVAGSAITGGAGTQTGAGTATHWAWTSADTLYWAAPLNAPVVLAGSGAFNADATVAGIPTA